MIHSTYLDTENKRTIKSIKGLKNKYIICCILKLMVLILSFGISYILFNMDIESNSVTIAILIVSCIVALVLIGSSIGLLSVTIRNTDLLKEYYGPNGATMMIIVAILDTLSSGLFVLVLFFAVLFQALALIMTISELVLIVILSTNEER